jgi:BON domain
MTTLPETDLAERLARTVRTAANGRVKSVRVTVGEGTVTVHGVAPSFYHKQLALEAARAALREHALALRLEITVHDR